MKQCLGGPGQLDRTAVELGESPAAPANDTSVWSIGDFLAWTAPSSPTSVTKDCPETSQIWTFAIVKTDRNFRCKRRR